MLAKELVSISDNKLVLFLERLHQFNPKLEHSYRLSDEIALKELKIALENVKIPEEIKNIKEKKYSYDTKSTKFLVRWAVFSAFWVIAVSFFLGVYYNSYKVNFLDQTEAIRYDNNWLNNYFDELKEKAPKSTQKFIKNNPFNPPSKK